MDEEGLNVVLERSRALGLLGPGPTSEHIVHGKAMAAALESAPESFLDLGSGGGVPGLVLALCWPEAKGALLDSAARRCSFLREAIGALGIEDRIEVVHDRAESAAHDPERRECFDAVFARSFGHAAVMAECASGFIKAGGELVVSEPPGGGRDWPTEQLAELGLALEGPHPGARSVVVFRKVRSLDQRFPRRVGIPAKRPLWR